MNRKERAKATLDQLVTLFESGELAQGIAQIHLIRRDPNDAPMPSAKWSYLNQMLMLISGTTDARGIRQWNEAGRKVCKGSSAVWILAPRIVKKKKDSDNGQRHLDTDEPEKVLIGFVGVPVFRLEDTEGQAVPHIDYTPPEPPPLADVAEAIGVSVEYAPASESSPVAGRYCSGSRKRILLLSHEEQVFFHELAHAAHDAIGQLALTPDKWRSEIVAELTAAVIGEMYGLSNHAFSAAYIRQFAERANKDVGRACASVLADTEKVLNFIWDKAEALATA